VESEDFWLEPFSATSTFTRSFRRQCYHRPIFVQDPKGQELRCRIRRTQNSYLKKAGGKKMFRYQNERKRATEIPGQRGRRPGSDTFTQTQTQIQMRLYWGSSSCADAQAEVARIREIGHRSRKQKQKQQNHREPRISGYILNFMDCHCHWLLTFPQKR